MSAEQIRVYSINRDYSGPAERVRLVTCRLTCDYPTKEFRLYLTVCSSCSNKVCYIFSENNDRELAIPSQNSPLNWSPNICNAPQTGLKAPICTWCALYFLKVVTKSLISHPKGVLSPQWSSVHSIGPQIIAQCEVSFSERIEDCTCHSQIRDENFMHLSLQVGPCTQQQIHQQILA